MASFGEAQHYPPPMRTAAPTAQEPTLGRLKVSPCAASRVVGVIGKTRRRLGRNKHDRLKLDRRLEAIDASWGCFGLGDAPRLNTKASIPEDGVINFNFSSTAGRPLNFDALEAINWSAGRLAQSNTDTVFSGNGFSIDFDGLRTTGNGVFTGSGGTVTAITIRISDGAVRDTYTFSFGTAGVSGATVGSWGATGSTLGFLNGLLGGDDLLGARDDIGSLVRGYGGNDLMGGRSGNDTIFGGAGNDDIHGDTGKDYLRGGDGNDLIFGNAGNDDINGNKGNDAAEGGDGDDWVVGGQDDDVLRGDGGFDIVYGNLGNDSTYGGDGADWVRGGQGDDLVDGGNGDDWLWGDRGSDTITGGAGGDIFHTFAGAGIDRVTDFNKAEGDRIVIDDKTAFSLAQVGSDAVIILATGDTVVLIGVQVASLGADWLALA